MFMALALKYSIFYGQYIVKQIGFGQINRHKCHIILSRFIQLRNSRMGRKHHFRGEPDGKVGGDLHHDLQHRRHDPLRHRCAEWIDGRVCYMGYEVVVCRLPIYGL